jgi:hypothetical protein
MFTSLDKALVAMIMGFVYIINTVFGFHFGFTEVQVAGFIGVLTPFIVYFWPNKKTS